MNKYKEYFYLFLCLLFIIILNFYKVYDGSNVFVGGDSLSPISFIYNTYAETSTPFKTYAVPLLEPDAEYVETSFK